MKVVKKYEFLINLEIVWISAGTGASYELDSPGSIPDNISRYLPQRVQDVSGAHPASYSEGTGGGG
jgi:hypothetical protein